MVVVVVEERSIGSILEGRFAQVTELQPPRSMAIRAESVGKSGEFVSRWGFLAPCSED